MQKTDIGNLLKQQRNTYVTTMFDYFKIEPNWPGRSNVIQQLQSGASLSASQKAQVIEDETHANIANLFRDCNARNRFVPYIEMHEFEALLFSNAIKLSNALRKHLSDINSIIEEFENPEEINDDPDTAPSKRLIRIDAGYRKVAMGKTISKSIGISEIRDKCPHFNDWLTKLESLR